MKNPSFFSLLFITAVLLVPLAAVPLGHDYAAIKAVPFLQQLPPNAAPDFTVTTSDGQVKSLYQDYINQQKLVVIEAFFTTCPPCATHAPLVKNLYETVQAAHPGQVEFILLSTLITDTNVKVAQYKTSKGLTMPGVGKDGGSITALQPYINGQFGQFQGTPTFIVIAPGSGMVTFDIRGISPSQTMALLEQKIEEYFPKPCKLEDPFGSPLSAVQIHANAPAFDTSISANGTYLLSPIAALKNSTYTLNPYKSDPPGGLTTYDLVLISKHILGLELLNCPWQQLAADVNCTGSITTFDIVTARKVILGILDTLPCGSWRFMPDSATVSNGACQDFTGVRLGDVNAGVCNDSLVGSAESRGAALELGYYPHDFQPGETVQIELFLKENIALEGLQLSLDFNPDSLKINAVESEMLEGFSSDSYQISERQLTLSWIQALGQRCNAATPLFRIELTAPKGGKLSELLHFSTTSLDAEAYPSGDQTRPIQLSSLPVPFTFQLSPNPAKDHFMLSTTALQAGDFKVQMLDIQGNIVLEHYFYGQKGLNQWEIQTPNSPPGIYLLKVNGKMAGKLVWNP